MVEPLDKGHDAPTAFGRRDLTSCRGGGCSSHLEGKSESNVTSKACKNQSLWKVYKVLHTLNIFTVCLCKLLIALDLSGNISVHYVHMTHCTLLSLLMIYIVWYVLLKQQMNHSFTHSWRGVEWAQLHSCHGRSPGVWVARQ